MAQEQGPKPETFGESGTTTPSEEAPRKSLREIAEEAYDEVEDLADGGPDDSSDPDLREPPVDDGGVRRDAHGRFAPKGEEPGVAAPPQEPSPDTTASGTQPPIQPTQPLTGEAAGAPANWGAEDRAAFDKLAPEGKQFLLKRHSEMEGEFQRRVQAVGGAAQFAESLRPIFDDQVIAQSLQQTGLSPHDAIHQWAGMHRRAYHPNPQERVNLLVEIAQNIGLNPAAIFATQSRPGQTGTPQLSEEDLKDPVIRHFADQLGQISNVNQQLRGELQQIRQSEQRAAQDQALKVTRWGIDSFADEKGSDGKPTHPHFDAVLPQVIELFRANPERDIKEAYETACWMNPEIRKAIATAEAARAQQQQSNQRGAAAARLNVRSRPPTGTLAKPNGAAEGPRSLRETIDASADEIGF